MKKRYRHIFNTLKSFIGHPFTAWANLGTDTYSEKDISRVLVIPSMLAITISTLAGYLLFAIAIQDFSVVYACIKAISVVFESFFTFYIAFLILFELRTRLKINIERPLLFRLMAYSFIPFWSAVFLSGILANYPTIGGFLRFLGVYGFMLFMLGIEHVQLKGEGKKGIFALVAFGLTLLIYHTISWSFSFLLKGVQYSDMFN